MCPAETKIENAGVSRVNGGMIITFDSSTMVMGLQYQRSGRNRYINTGENLTESVFFSYPGILIPVLMEHSTSANQQGNVESRSVKLR